MTLARSPVLVCSQFYRQEKKDDCQKSKGGCGLVKYEIETFLNQACKVYHKLVTAMKKI